MNPIFPSLKPYKVRTTTFVGNDSPWPWAVEDVKDYYNLEPQPSFPFYRLPLSMGGILLEMDFDKMNFSRTVATYDTWLIRIGGFSASILSIFAFILSLVSVWSLDKYLVTKLFYRYNPLPNQPDAPANSSHDQMFKNSKMGLNERKRI